MTTNTCNKVDGFITNEHTDEIETVFGSEVADRVRNADTNTTFLSLLFADFAK